MKSAIVSTACFGRGYPVGRRQAVFVFGYGIGSTDSDTLVEDKENNIQKWRFCSMSGFYLLGLTIIWLITGWVIYRIWRRWKPADQARKIMHIIIGILLFSVWFGGAFWEVAGKKMYWDAKVRELCAKDGGVKVYETVELPAEKFNKWGQINFERPTLGENSLGPEYLVKDETRFLRPENKQPAILRHHYQVFRRSDGKLMGERIAYARRGGTCQGFGIPLRLAVQTIENVGFWMCFSPNQIRKGVNNEHHRRILRAS